MVNFLISFLRTATELPGMPGQPSGPGSDTFALNVSIFMVSILVLLVAALAILAFGLARRRSKSQAV